MLTENRQHQFLTALFRRVKVVDKWLKVVDTHSFWAAVGVLVIFIPVIVALLGYGISLTFASAKPPVQGDPETYVTEGLTARMLKGEGDASISARTVTQQLQDRTSFQRQPLFRWMLEDMVRWLEQRQGERAPESAIDEEREFLVAVSSRFLEIRDPAVLAALETTPEGKHLFAILSSMPNRVGEDRSSIVVSYAMLLPHYRLFMDIDMQYVKNVERECELLTKGIGAEPFDADERAGADER